MSNLQLYLAIGLPVVANAAMFLLFQSNIHRLLDAFRSEIDARFEAHSRNTDIRIEALRKTMDARFDALTQALLRVEQVMDPRPRLLEQPR